MLTCLVVPCYNEEKRLDQKAFLSFVGSQIDTDILFVNDGSRDKTLNVLVKLSKLQPRLKVMSLEKNGGKARAVQQGFLSLKNSDYEYIGYWDADLATPFNALADFFKVFDENEKVVCVIGSRVNRLGAKIRRKFIRHYLGRIFATITGFMLEIPVYDTQCGAKIFKKSVIAVFEEPFCSKWFFDVELFFRLKLLFQKETENLIYEIPLKRWEDVRGGSIKLIDYFKVPFELIKIYIHYKR